MKSLLKNLFKYKSFEFWRFSITVFQRNRYDISIGLDCNEWPLFWISLIFISLEINLMKGFYEWKHPSSEEKERIGRILGMSKEERHKLAMKNLFNDIFGGEDV